MSSFYNSPYFDSELNNNFASYSALHYHGLTRQNLGLPQEYGDPYCNGVDQAAVAHPGTGYPRFPPYERLDQIRPITSHGAAHNHAYNQGGHFGLTSPPDMGHVAGVMAGKGSAMAPQQVASPPPRAHAGTPVRQGSPLARPHPRAELSPAAPSIPDPAPRDPIHDPVVGMYCESKVGSRENKGDNRGPVATGSPDVPLPAKEAASQSPASGDPQGGIIADRGSAETRIQNENKKPLTDIPDFLSNCKIKDEDIEKMSSMFTDPELSPITDRAESPSAKAQAPGTPESRGGTRDGSPVPDQGRVQAQRQKASDPADESAGNKSGSEESKTPDGADCDSKSEDADEKKDANSIPMYPWMRSQFGKKTIKKILSKINEQFFFK